MSGTVHIIGAGLAGLSAAVTLAHRKEEKQQKPDIIVYEAAGHAGGRCRSYFDATLNTRIDNGNHLMLSGNDGVMEYLARIGAIDTLTGPDRAAFPFYEVKTGLRWVVQPGRSAVPWWLLSSARRIPETNISEYLRGARLAWAGPEQTIRDCLDGPGTLYQRFWEPLAVSVLNTAADEASASLLWPVMRETFGRGEAACRPRIVREGLSESLINPALDYLKKRDVEVKFSRRLRSLDLDGGRANRLDFGDQVLELAADDAVILAVPHWIAGTLLPGITAPVESRAIVNAHFLLPSLAHQPSEVELTGLAGGIGQWLFVRGNIASVTVSAADQLAALDSKQIAESLWPEVASALDLKDVSLPIYRIVKEKRATFAQTPAQISRRPDTLTKWSNVLLAGDWTRTGLPATIEGAVISGRKAADILGLN